MICTRQPALPALLLSLALLCGCAAPVPSPRAPEDRVRDRAQQRVQALLARDFAKAYAYLSPASRGIVRYEDWLGTLPRATVWKSAQVHSVQCAVSDRCTVRLEIEHRPLVFGSGSSTIRSAVDETWLVDNGEWWLLFQR